MSFRNLIIALSILVPAFWAFWFWRSIKRVEKVFGKENAELKEEVKTAFRGIEKIHAINSEYEKIILEVSAGVSDSRASELLSTAPKKIDHTTAGDSRNGTGGSEAMHRD